AACAVRPTPPPELPTASVPPSTAAPAPVVPPAPPVGRNAITTGVTLERPQVLGADDATKALTAFRISCPVVTARNDASGLTVGSDWQGVCAQAASLDPSFAPGFFYYGFDWVRVGEGRAFMTGYYEPEIEGSRTPRPGYAPI